ncbi:MAG: acyltransferase [Sphingomonas sp.]|nr:MAG: acyltransferase [Sphingomonas sp.]
MGIALSAHAPDYSEHRRFQSLQTLRFVAATLVAAAHSVDAIEYQKLTSILSGTTFADFGAVGVDIFFVISGFIITLTARRTASAQVFWCDRFLRVAPIYWLLSIPMAAWTYHRHALTLPMALTTVTFWPAWGGIAEPILAVGWTLSFEMLFYLCFGLTIGHGNRQWPIMVYAVALAFCLTIGTPVFHFVGNPIIIEFLFGVLIATTIPRGYGAPALAMAIVWFAALLIFGFGSIGDVDATLSASLSLRRVLLWGIPSALLVYGAINLERHCTGRAWAVLARMGDASYSLYLTHVYAVLVVALAARKLRLPFDVTLIGILAAILGGWTAFHFIETPIQRLIKARRRNSLEAFQPGTQLAVAQRLPTS